MASPADSTPCPKAAACWSPAQPAIGIGAPSRSAAISPKPPLDGRTSGRIAAGTSKMRSRSSLQASRPMSKSSVRLALVTSVACTRPPVSRQMRNASTVPNKTSPAAHRARSPGTVSSKCTILVAEK